MNDDGVHILPVMLRRDENYYVNTFAKPTCDKCEEPFTGRHVIRTAMGETICEACHADVVWSNWQALQLDVAGMLSDLTWLEKRQYDILPAWLSEDRTTLRRILPFPA